MPLNEADTRARLIDPRLEAAGWGSDQVSREHYYRRDVQYTPGRIVLRGDQVRRRTGRKVDYLLRFSGFPIAIAEAKAEGEPPERGLEQVKGYARDLGVPFVYATSGHSIVEYDYFTRQGRELPAFPSPDEAWHRWLTNTGLSEITDPQRVADARALYDPQAAEAQRRAAVPRCGGRRPGGAAGGDLPGAERGLDAWQLQYDVLERFVGRALRPGLARALRSRARFLCQPEAGARADEADRRAASP